MSFTNTEKAQIRRYMGATRRFLDFTSSEYPLEQAMDVVGDDPDTISIVRQALSDLAGIETSLKESHIQAGVEAVGTDGIKLKSAKRFFLLRQEGRRFVSVISDALGLRPLRDAFTSRQTTGDDV